jgi:hypothetical protein
VTDGHPRRPIGAGGRYPAGAGAIAPAYSARNTCWQVRPRALRALRALFWGHPSKPCKNSKKRVRGVKTSLFGATPNGMQSSARSARSARRPTGGHNRHQMLIRLDVRFGSSLPIHLAPVPANVRYASDSDRQPSRDRLTLCASSGLMHRNMIGANRKTASRRSLRNLIRCFD